MDPRRILILDGHPDPQADRFCHALAKAYGEGAAHAGHVVHRISLSELDFPALASRMEWEEGTPCPAIKAFQDELVWAQHLVVIYPLWLGSMPARLKALFEQAFRPDFGFGGKAASPGAGQLKGRSARIIVTMGMPGVIFRTVFFSHSLMAFRRGMLALLGFGPIRGTVIGGVETRKDRDRLLGRMAAMGVRAA